MADNTKSYKSLFLNTLIFALGSFGSKLLVIILVPLYTKALSPDEYGTVDLIAQTANILIPIFTLAISEAALRFGLDAKSISDRKKVYSVCLRVLAIGLIIMAAVFPVLAKFDYLDGYELVLYIYIWTSSLRQLNATFVRSIQKVKVFAIDGVICTLAMLLLNLLFLLKFKWGIIGYLLAIILSDVISSVFLFIMGRLWKYITFGHIEKALIRDIIKYAAPMVPSTVLWIFTSVSDHFVVRFFYGAELNGILVIAYKIPMVLTTVFTMFSQAWNMSAVLENKSGYRESFYTNIFSFNQSFMYTIAAGILLFIKPITYVWVDPEYFIAYKYSPLLTLATVFTCFNVFLGSVYIAEKKTRHTFYTSLAAGISNIVLNIILIPSYGINGAAIATFVSYFGVFFFRLFDTRRYIRFDFSMKKIVTNTLLLAAMVIIDPLDIPPLMMYSVLITLFITVVINNFRDLLKIAVLIVPAKIKSRFKLLESIEKNIVDNQEDLL